MVSIFFRNTLNLWYFRNCCDSILYAVYAVESSKCSTNISVCLCITYVRFDQSRSSSSYSIWKLSRANQFPILSHKIHIISICFFLRFCYFCKWVEVNFSNVRSNNKHPRMEAGIQWIEKWSQCLYLTGMESTVTANSNCHPFCSYTIIIPIRHCCNRSRPVDSFWYRFRIASVHCEYDALHICMHVRWICDRIRAIPLFRHSMRSNRLLLLLFRWKYKNSVAVCMCARTYASECHIF